MHSTFRNHQPNPNERIFYLNKVSITSLTNSILCAVQYTSFRKSQIEAFLDTDLHFCNPIKHIFGEISRQMPYG